MRKHILVDANVAAAAFEPRTTGSQELRSNAHRLLKQPWTSFEPVFLIPNFCIAEVFNVFEKYRWGASWNQHVQPQNRLTKKQFASARKRFYEAIHNGEHLLQCELNRYHILCVDLITPINAAYQIKRHRTTRPNVTPARTYDLLLIAMGIWLQKQVGKESFALVTGDNRVARILRRARSPKLSRAMREHLQAVAKGLSLPYGADVYPRVADLAHDSDAKLQEILGEW